MYPILRANEKRGIVLWREWQSNNLGTVLVNGIRRWWKSLDRPDPWPAELDAAVRAPDAIPVCHHCTTPCSLPVWFCPACGASVGPYNNILPFVRIFSSGEVLRSGLQPTARFTLLTVPGYIFLAMHLVIFLAPFYYLRLVANYLKIKRYSKTKAGESVDD